VWVRLGSIDQAFIVGSSAIVTVSAIVSVAATALLAARAYSAFQFSSSCATGALSAASFAWRGVWEFPSLRQEIPVHFAEDWNGETEEELQNASPPPQRSQRAAIADDGTVGLAPELKNQPPQPHQTSVDRVFVASVPPIDF